MCIRDRINTVRVDAMKAVVAQYPDMKIIDSQPGDWNVQKLSLIHISEPTRPY